jgi:hypothetical protein
VYSTTVVHVCMYVHTYMCTMVKVPGYVYLYIFTGISIVCTHTCGHTYLPFRDLSPSPLPSLPLYMCTVRVHVQLPPLLPDVIPPLFIIGMATASWPILFVVKRLQIQLNFTQKPRTLRVPQLNNDLIIAVPRG